ncbi:DUF2267 domain-containing protein [candidate division GN15 bacterium]|nr:DUF2267 domain-containing protein [candidate division GN15 bacterium]
MQYSDFIGHVQHRARLDSQNDAVRATRATLQTLAERIGGGEPADLAAQLPGEIGYYLTNDTGADPFSVDEFINRVSRRAEVEFATARNHARAVFDVIRDAISQGEFEDIRAQLPDDYRELFEAPK